MPSAEIGIASGPAGPSPAIVLVVPCYNEASRLTHDPWLVFLENYPTYRLIFVNDGSTDDTDQILDEVRSRSPDRVQVLSLDRNRGKAEAVRAGMLEGLSQRPAAVGFWDADLSTPLEAAPAFQDILDERPRVDVVTGARVQMLGWLVERSAYRHYVGRVFATFASITLGLPVYDTQCGAKLFRSNERVAALFRDPFLARWAFDVEVLARLGVELGSRSAVADAVYELPLHRWAHAPGSKVGLLDFPKSMLELFRISRRYRS